MRLPEQTDVFGRPQNDNFGRLQPLDHKARKTLLIINVGLGAQRIPTLANIRRRPCERGRWCVYAPSVRLAPSVHNSSLLK